MIKEHRVERMYTESPDHPRRPGFARHWPLLIILVMTGLIVFQNLSNQAGNPTPKAQPRSIQPRGDLAADEKSTIELFEQAAPSVVYITTLTFQRDFYSFNVHERPKGTGSGFIWDNNGHIVTNFHVLQGADSARVTLSDQSSWDARLVGAAPDKDIAVLQISATKSKMLPISIGESHNLKVGQKVFAIGNPFGLDQTLTTGIISQVGRTITSVNGRPISGVIQTDAAINPGNSGGPLLDSAGRLIGVNTAIYSPSGSSAGVGFAVPVDTVNKIVPQLIKNGKITRPGFGITIFPDAFTQARGMTGVLIREVVKDSAADKAGMRPTFYDGRQIRLGDLIVAVGDQPVENSDGLNATLEGKQVGDTVIVTINREGEVLKLKVILQALD